MAAAGLASVLPQPKFTATNRENVEAPVVERAVAQKSSIPPYGQRKGWFPQSEEDFGDGGAYPEVHRAQYPLNMGKSSRNGDRTLALQVDGEGNVQWDAIAHQGHRDGRHVQSSYKDLVPLAHRTDELALERQAMERPSDEDINATAARTQEALQKLTTAKVRAAQPKALQIEKSKENYVRYTPASTGQQRIIKMTDVVEDPLEPARFKGKKIPRGPPSPPPPIMRSPPRKLTAQDQKDWMIPPCVSNWKNHKGYTVPLDKRLAADGRGLQELQLNDRFASFSEALYTADRHARDEVRHRAQLQQRIAEKEKEEKEENLREMARRAREERAGLPSQSSKPRVAGSSGAEGGATLAAAMAGYGSDSDSDAPRTESPKSRRSDNVSDDEDSGDDDAARERDRQREERRREREREMRMSNMGTEQRARTLARAQNRDISEKIALGLAKPTMSKEAMVDSRLYNREQLPASYGDEDSYNLYDRPLFQGSSAAAAIYKAPARTEDESEMTEEGVRNSLKYDRFGIGKGFEGAELQEDRDGPVQFEKESADPFGVDAFLGSVSKGKRKGEEENGDSRKKAREEEDDL